MLKLYLGLGPATVTAKPPSSGRRLDKRFADAVESLRKARGAGQELADYDDFLAARAEHERGNEQAAEALLRGFAQRYPDSIFSAQAPELEAQALLALNQTARAAAVLKEAEATEAKDRPGFDLAKAKVDEALGRTDEAVSTYKHLLLAHPNTLPL